MSTPKVSPHPSSASVVATWLLGVGLLAGLALMAFWLKSTEASSVPVGAAPQAQPTPETVVSALVYVQSDPIGQTRRLMQGPPSSDIAGRTQRQAKADAPLAAADIPPGCDIAGMHPAPHGQWVAQQVGCEDSAYVLVVDANSGQTQNLAAALGPDSLFLNWLPTGNEAAVKVDIIGNPRVYVVNVANSKAELLPVPATTYDVAFSRNGQQMLYALTQGLGYGSELWLANTDGRNARRVLADPTHIIAYARWSPAGDALAYIRMPDLNIPFTVGELWVADGNGGNAMLLGEADAGHGYEPAWSPDGAQIAFVGRENKDDVAADQVAERLVSNIYVADVKARKAERLTQFNGALAENPAWSPDGAALAFSASAGGQGMDVWTFDMKGKQLTQATHGANARYPGWLKEANVVAPQPAVESTTLAPEVTEEMTPTLLAPPALTETITPIETPQALSTIIVTVTPTETQPLTAAPIFTLPDPSATVVLTVTPLETLTLTVPFPTDTLNPVTASVTLTR